MQLVDTHCHLQFERLHNNLDMVLADAKNAGVNRIVSVGTTLADSQQSVEIAARHDNVWAAAGVHPHDAQEFLEDAQASKKLNELLKKPRVIAVGEIGLDYFKNYTPADVQLKALRVQIEVALSQGLPFIFHVREAWQDFWPIVDEYKIKNAVVHSFSAGVKELDQALSRGFYVALNGIMTFTKDTAQLEAAKKVPLDKMLLETDAPFLAPAGFRGQICEPKHVAVTAEFLAGLRGDKLETLARMTTNNAIKFFGLE